MFFLGIDLFHSVSGAWILLALLFLGLVIVALGLRFFFPAKAPGHKVIEMKAAAATPVARVTEEAA